MTNLPTCKLFTLLFAIFCFSGNLAHAGVTFTIIDREGNLYEHGDSITPNATPWAQQTRIDSDFAKITITSTDPITSYRVHYGTYASQSTYLVPSSSSVFFEDYSLYRSEKDQWVRLIVQTASGSEELQLGLAKGTLTAPPDDPILPVDYVAEMGQGHNWKHTWDDSTKNSQSEMDKWAVGFKRNGFRHVRYKTNKFEYFLDAGNRPMIDMQIDTLLRHNLKVVWTKNDPEELYPDLNTFINAYSNFWEQVSTELKYKSHNLCFEFFQELPAADLLVGSRGDPNAVNYNNLLDKCTTAIRNNAPTHNLVYSSNKRSDPDALQFLGAPFADTGPYFFFEFHDWASGPARADVADKLWNGLGTDLEKQTLIDQFNDARAWSAAKGVPVWFGAIHSNSENMGNTQYVPERISFLQFVMDLAETGAPGMPPIPVCFLGYNYDVTTDSFPAFHLPVLEVKNKANTWDPTDRDGDGLSNEDEINLYLTDPDLADTDHDNIVDGEEIRYGFDPLDMRDGHPVGFLDHVNADADGDAMGNAWEILQSYNYKKKLKISEYGFQHPLDPTDGSEDLDKDNLKAYWESLIWYTPCYQKSSKGSTDDIDDIDEDGVNNLAEFMAGTWPADTEDHDLDGLKGANDPVPYVNDAGMVLRYAFDNAPTNLIVDTSSGGRNNSGTLQNNASVTNNVLNLSGTADHILIPATTDLNSTETDARTVILQFKANTTAPDFQILYEEGNETDGLCLYLAGEEAWVGVYNGGAASFMKVARIGTVDWHTVALSFLGEERLIRAHFDRRLVGERPLSFTALAANNGNITLGGSSEPTRFHDGSVLGDRTFNGQIDNVHIFNRRMSDVEVGRLSKNVTNPTLRRWPFFLGNPIEAPKAEPDAAYEATAKDLIFDYNLTDTHTFSATGVPGWLTFSNNGEMSGTPTVADLGTNSFSVRVTDNTSRYDDALISIIVATNPPPSTLSTNSFVVAEDTYIHEKSTKAGDNYGTETDLQLRYDIGQPSRFVLLKFNVGSVTGTVTSAKLKVYSITIDAPVDARETESTWSELSVTYNTRPSYGPVIGNGRAYSNSWFEIDVTDYITGNGTFSFLLDETGSTLGKIASREHSSGNAAKLIVISSTAETKSPYETWGSDYGLSGPNAELTANPDNDEFSNLFEFALGGNPFAGGDAIAPEGILSGVNMNYIYRRRTDAAEVGLAYSVELTDNLVDGIWTNTGYTVTGTAPAETGFETVTNQIPTDRTNRFIRLRVDLEP